MPSIHSAYFRYALLGVVMLGVNFLDAQTILTLGQSPLLTLCILD